MDGIEFEARRSQLSSVCLLDSRLRGNDEFARWAKLTNEAQTSAANLAGLGDSTDFSYTEELAESVDLAKLAGEESHKKSQR